MSDPAPAAPAPDASAPVPPSVEASAAAPAAPAGPSRAEQSARTKLKVAGLIMLIFGAFVAVQAGPAAFLYAQESTWTGQEGGNLTVVVAGHPGATVRFLYPDGTSSTAATDAAGNATLHATVASFRLQVTADNATVERKAIVPPGTFLAAPINLADANVSRVGFDPNSAHWLWVPAILSLVVALGGIAAFRRQGQLLAMLGSWAFLAGTSYLLLSVFFNLSGVVFAITAAACLWFIQRGRALIAPGWAFWRRA